MNQEQFHVSAELRILLPTASVLGPHTTTSRAGTLGRLCNMSMLHYLKKKNTLVSFAFTEIILRLLIKSLIFGMSLAYFHTATAPLKFLKWIHVNTTSFLKTI